MATPYVAGLAAFLWSFSPSLAHDTVREVIYNTADDLGSSGWDQYFGDGRINVWRALEAISLALQSTDGEPVATPLQLTIHNADDEIYHEIQVTTANPDNIAWSVSISPTVTWLDVSSPTSGVVSTSSAPIGLNLVATRPVTYGVYTTNLVITGLTASGTAVVPVTTEIQLDYVPYYHYYFPLSLSTQVVSQ